MPTYRFALAWAMGRDRATDQAAATRGRAARGARVRSDRDRWVAADRAADIRSRPRITGRPPGSWKRMNEVAHALAGLPHRVPPDPRRLRAQPP
jgi:hypothetical protein